MKLLRSMVAPALLLAVAGCETPAAVCDRPENERVVAREALALSGLYIACLPKGSRYSDYMLTKVRP